MPIGLSNSVLNQKNAPAIYEDIYANRPAAGFSGRIFISTDTSQIFVDTGSTWVLIANTGIGSTGNLQVVTTNGNTTNAGISITAGGFATNAAQITGLTQDGGVLLTNASGNIIQDVNFTFDTTNNYLGIGPTGIPTAPLDIHNGTLGVFMQLNATSTNNSTISFQNASVGKWRIGNLYSGGSNLFHIYNNTAANNSLTIDSSNAATFTGTITGSSIIKSGGTSSQFLKANGSVDSNTYITLSSLSATSPQQYNNTTGVFSILQASTSQAGYLSSTDWNTFNNKASLTAFSATTPLSYNNSTGAFSIQVANTGQSGYLTNTDWNTFNNKQAALSFGNLTETSSSVLTIAGGTGAVIGSGTTIAVNQAGSTQSGYLSSTDWNTFNNKQPQINGTGFVKASGTTISYDNSTYYLASNPSGYITLSSLSGTTPINFNTGTGAISITQATTSTSGYLSSTDWNTFNGKASLSAFSASPPLSYNSGTGAFSITQSSGSTNGYLSSTDWTTFNNKQSALTNPITGTGTTGYIPKFSGSTSLTSSIIQDNGNTVTITSNSGDTILLQKGSGPSIQFSKTSATAQQWALAGEGSAFKLYDYTAGTIPFQIAVGTGAASFSNQVLINGTTSTNSSAYLQVFGSTQASTNNGQIRINDSSTTTKTLSLGVDGANNNGFIQSFQDGVAYRPLLLNANGGNVGIGTTNPSGASGLALAINGGASQTRIALKNSTTGDSAGNGFQILLDAGALDVALENRENGGIRLATNGTTRISILNSGQTLFNGSTSSNGQGVLQNTGQSFTGGLGIGGLTFSTNTTATVNTSFYFFNGGAGITLTMPDTNGQSMVYYIKNYSASPLTIGRTGSNTFIAVGTIVTTTSLTLASGASATLLGNGTTNYIQLL